MSELGDDWSFSLGLVKCQDWAFFLVRLVIEAWCDSMNYSMEFHGKNLIAGSWEDGMPEAGFQSRNSNTGEVLEPIYNDASLEQVKVAIDEANQAFADLNDHSRASRRLFGNSSD